MESTCKIYSLSQKLWKGFTPRAFRKWHPLVFISGGVCEANNLQCSCSQSGLEIENTAVGIRHADYVAPLYPQTLAVTSPTSGRSVVIVRSRTQAAEFFFMFVFTTFNTWTANQGSCWICSWSSVARNGMQLRCLLSHQWNPHKILRDFSPRENCTDLAIAASRRS
jgi:hypothetical protein